MTSEERILGWHFADGMKLPNDESLVVGKTYHIDGDIELCLRGLHASRQILDALKYAPGTTLSRVESWGDVQECDDKLVARNRRVLWTLDATMVLHEFACRVAEDALSRVDKPDPRSVAAIAAKRAWMRGEIDDDSLCFAKAAAMDAAMAAEMAAEMAATWATEMKKYSAWLEEMVLKARDK